MSLLDAKMPYKIVVGYDGSESAKRALDRAATLTDYGSSLTVVTVARDSDDLEKSRRLLSEAGERLMLLRVFAEQVERIGRPADELMEAVKERDADLLIVGHGKNALQSLLRGSVSQALTAHAPCEVLVA